MNEKFPIEKAADYSARIQAGLTPTLKYITAEEVYTEFNKRCGNGMLKTLHPSLVFYRANIEKKIKVRKVTLTKNNHNALISLHIANIIRPIDKNYRQKIFNTPKQPSFIL